MGRQKVMRLLGDARRSLQAVGSGRSKDGRQVDRHAMKF
jgi:hypothetical protein